MNPFEKVIKTLETYKPALTKRSDHDKFWEDTLQKARKKELNEKLIELNYPIKQIKAYQLTYHGFDQTPIHAFYIVPSNHEGKLPCLIFFHGYGGDKHSIANYMQWLIQGYAVIAIDCRGQGKSGDYSTYSSGVTGSWVTKGILDKEEYYYRKVYIDGVRAIDFAYTRPEIDINRIGVIGSSMGGGIALAVTALDKRPNLVIANMPNMCDIPLAIEQKTEGSLTLIEDFLHRFPEHIDRVYSNMTYFDNLNLSEDINCLTKITIGLKDTICPPKPIFGVYNRIKSEKLINIYPFTGHDLHIADHVDKTICFINENL